MIYNTEIIKTMNTELEQLEEENDKIIKALERLPSNKQMHTRQRLSKNNQRMSVIRNLIDIYEN
tara:strand:+ start:400 stop:591 length:192 start_codon:yes stop_codon:yes gene_type:complete